MHGACVRACRSQARDERAKERAELLEQIATLENQRLNAMIEAARHEATVIELREQLVDKKTSMEAWVRSEMCLNLTRVDFDACDEYGSKI